MTTKDYIRIARAIRAVSEITTSETAVSVIEAVVGKLMLEFEEDNPSFDRKKFREAAIFPHEPAMILKVR